MDVSRLYRLSSWSHLLIWMLILVPVFYLFTIFPYAQGAHELRRSLGFFVWSYSSMESWEHCRIVPLAIAFLVYQRWPSLKTIPLHGSSHGLLILFIASLLFWLGYAINDYYVGFASCQLLLLGLILWIGGKTWFNALSFEWLFLLFVWPLLFADNWIAFPLRMLVSKLAYFVLSGIGIGCLQVGTSLVSAAQPELGLREGARFALDVANPCSGIRSLFALLMVSALYGALIRPSSLKRWLIFLAAFPLAIAGNLARIVTLTFGTLLFGPQFAIGTLENPSNFHIGAGLLVFAVALVGMISFAWALEQNWKEKWATWKSTQNTRQTVVRHSRAEDL